MKKYYTYYFEQLAQKNKLLASTDAAPAFYFVRDKYDLEAFDNAIKSVGKTPALLLEDYGYDTSTGNSRNFFKQINGRFTILAKADVGDQSTIDGAHELCEMIAEQLLARMRSDFEAGAVITIPGDGSSKTVFFDLTQVKVDPVGPVSTSYYGVSVGFPFKSPLNAAVDFSDWTS